MRTRTTFYFESDNDESRAILRKGEVTFVGFASFACNYV